MSMPAPLTLSEQLSALTGKQRALLRTRLEQEGARYGVAPLSCIQEQFWLFDQFHPGDPAYNIGFGVRLSGELNLSALESAIASVRSRHAILRSTFPAIDGQPLQVIQQDTATRVAVADLSGLGSAAYGLLEHQAQNLMRHGFDLTNGPLLRCILFRLASAEHVLIFAMQHIVADRWSVNIVSGEIARAYRAFLNGTDPAGAIPMQYADFARWQRASLRDDKLADQLAFWKTLLADRPAATELPGDRPRPVHPSRRGASVSAEFPPSLRDRLKALATQENASLFMILLAGFQALLHRYTGDDRIVIGTVAAGRERSETEEVVGCFSNTLTLRLELSNNLPFRELLRRSRAGLLEALAHQSVPFEKVVAAVQPERSLDRHPLFQIALTLQNTPQTAVQLPGLHLHPYRPRSSESRFDLGLELFDGPDGIGITAEYSTELYDEGTIERFLNHWRVLLEATAESPDSSIGTLPLVPSEEEEWLERSSSGRQVSYPLSLTVAGMIAQQARLAPQKIAARCGPESLTFASLEARANALRERLLRSGVNPGAHIGVSLERTIDIFPAVLAVWKAGFVYVPLDPSLPNDRLHALAADAQISLLITQPETAARWAGFERLMIGIEEPVPGSVQPIPPTPVASDRAAYMIYTSGTTGVPKGVLISHASLVNCLLGITETLGLDHSHTIACVVPFGFDFSIFQLFGPLVRGGECLLLPSQSAVGPEELARTLEPATFFDAVPIVIRRLLEYRKQHPELMPRIQKLWVGGDRVEPWLLRQMHETFPDAQVFTAYGPTEGTIACTYAVIPPGWRDHRCIIGRPFPNTVVRVCDPILQPCPVGVLGEICIAGEGVAQGYWNRPELTAERFVVAGGHRYYCTGDLGRLLADGSIEFVGRKDGQVKIRGCRVEFGEIESALLQIAGVLEVAVTVTSVDDEERRLLAYVSGPVDGETVRQALRRKLPHYMVPWRVIVLDRLPLNQNGKLDRSALPGVETLDREVEYGDEPQTDVERTLAAIWGEILGANAVGIHDNFFELGGDSILSIQAIARAKQAGLQLTPRQLFENQTIAELALVAEQRTPVGAPGASGERRASLAPIQRWWFDQPVSRRDWFTQSVVLLLECDTLAHAWEGSFAAVVAQHEALRTRFVRDPSQDVCRIYVADAESAKVFGEIDLRAVPESFTASLWQRIGRQAQRSLSLNKGPLIRALLARTACRDELLIVVHHLSVDAVSWGILLGDLRQGYSQLASGSPVTLPPPSTSFLEWAHQLASFCESSAVLDEAGFWSNADRLRRALPPLNTPEQAGRATLTLDAEITRRLLHDAHLAYRTSPGELLLSALGSAWCRSFGTPEVVIDVERHGREYIDTGADVTRTIGWFTSLHPVVLSDGETDQEIIVTNKERMRAAPHAGIGYLATRRKASGRDAAADMVGTTGLTFNYLGQLELIQGARDFWQVVPNPLPPEPEGLPPRPPLAVTAFVAGGRLQIDLAWDGQRLDRRRAEAFGAEYTQALQRLVLHCCAQCAVTLHPSDFPNLGVSQDMLDRLLDHIESSK